MYRARTPASSKDQHHDPLVGNQAFSQAEQFLIGSPSRYQAIAQQGVAKTHNFTQKSAQRAQKC